MSLLSVQFDFLRVRVYNQSGLIDKKNEVNMKKHTGRPQIGLVSDSCIESYNAKLWDGVIEGARECDVNLFCFMGGALRSPFSFFSKSNVIYDLISRETLDGLIVNSGSLGNFISREEYRAFLEKFAGIPCINIGGDIPGMTNIVVDNEKGMREIITHLIEVHGHRKIAFIRGPEGIKDADIRFKAYRDTLSEHGIRYDERIVFPGDFMSLSGKKAVHTIMENPGLEIDAIVAANDVMAIEAISQLEKKGKDVPQDIAVVGFDDREASRYLSKPLTTVEQPISEIGRTAVLTLVAKLRGEAIPGETILPTKAIIRNSCGCTIATARQMAIEGGISRKKDVFEEIRDCGFVKSLVGLVKPVYATILMPDTLAVWMDGLIGSLVRSAREKSQKPFLKELERVVIASLEKHIDIQSFNEVIYAILGKVAACLEAPAEIEIVNNLWKDALILIRDIQMRNVGHSMITENNMTLRLHWINKRLISVFSPDALRELIIEEFHHLGIKSTYISLYRDSLGSRDEAVFIAGFEYCPFEVTDSTPTIEEEEIPLAVNFVPGKVPETEHVFPSTMLIPAFMKPTEERKSFIVLPLFFQDEQLGFVIFEIGPKNGNIYETLAIQLSSAFMSIRLFNQVEQYTLQLEKKVDERTAHLYSLNEQLKEEMKEKQRIESQLLQAQKMEAIGRLAGGIAHDFNNIIATILGYSEYMLEDPTVNGEQKESIQEIMSASLRAKTLIKQLLAFSHKQVLTLEEIDLNQLIRNMEKMLNPLIGENVTIRTTLGRDVKPVLADPGQVEQVIMNLVVNSRDALPRGGKIIIKTANAFVTQEDTHLSDRIKPGPYTQLLVSDNGTGMDRETLEKIFEPFFTTKERGKGTGLGLSTVFGIVKQSGGCVDVESEPGKGTSFCIYLPQIPKPAKKAKTEPRPHTSEKLSGDETILLVEDDEEFGRVAAKMIARYGYTVFSAKNGQEALGLLTDGGHEDINIVITDVIMPGMSGRELAEEIAKIIPHMKVLYISGYTGTEISIEKIIGKSVMFLQKPFSAPELAAKVREALDTGIPLAAGTRDAGRKQD